MQGKRQLNERWWNSAFLGILVCFCTLQAAPNNIFTRRSTRIDFASFREASLEYTTGIMKRAKNAGYNLAMIDGILFPTASKLKQTSLDRIRRLRSNADQIGINLMPMSLGQLDASMNDIIHAEAFPIPKQKFLASGGIAKPMVSPVAIPNAGFEEWDGNMPKGWKSAGMAPGVKLFRDTQVFRSGASSVRGENPDAKTLCIYTYVNLEPNRVYEVSAWIKTEGMEVSKEVGIEVIHGHDWLLCVRDTRGVARTQDWRKHAWSFYSKQYKRVIVRLAFSYFHYSATGKVWFDDVQIKQMGLSSAQRRSTTPVNVFSADDPSRQYREGTDYTVESDLKDPHFDGYLELPAGSAIKEGEKLLVDWYHIARAELTTPGASFCHKEAWDVLRENTRVLADAMGTPGTWFLKPSEWRTIFWDPACIGQYKNAGLYMGDVLKKEVDLLREFNPDVETYVWNDAFDPYHNARSSYYHINPLNGGALNSWQTMDSKTIVKTWHPNHKPTLYFFAGKDPEYPTYKHPQVGCFHHGGGIDKWLKALDEFEKDYPNEKDVVVGIHYSTWVHWWDGLEPLAETCRKSGRWMDNDTLMPIQFANVGTSSPGLQGSPKALQVSRLRLTGSEAGIQYSIPRNAHVRITVRDVSGRMVAALADAKVAAGRHHISWEKKIPVAGIYIVRLAVRNGSKTQSVTRKITVL